jgi:uncharacterized RDD family membrane protein YckC
MASAATATSPRYKTEKVVNFVPEQIAAPFVLRLAALFMDYMLLLSVPVLALLWEKCFGDGNAYAGPGRLVWTIGVFLWVVNFLLFPLLRGQTIGKMLTGLTILNLDGTEVSLVGILRRNVFGYIATALTLGIGFIASIFSSRGRTLHDLIGGTVVVRGRKTQIY